MIRTADAHHHGYDGCIRLENGRAEVILGPACGGRVLRYAWEGANSLALLPEQAGWTWRAGGPEIDPWGGRFDIGPEKTIAPHPTLWLGAWSAETAPDGAVRLRSAPDPATGLQLAREFRLDAQSSHLRCRQVVTNVSSEARTFCHWGRTMTPGGGIVVVPDTPGSHFPCGYVQYDSARPTFLDFAPRDPSVRRRDGFLEICGPLQHPKLCFDTLAGWMAYLEVSGLLFVKRWPVFPERPSAEIGPFTLSIWLYQDRFCELEPIGPAERLEPGASASFVEDWWLLPVPFPSRRDALDLRAVAERVEREARVDEE